MSAFPRITSTSETATETDAGTADPIVAPEAGTDAAVPADAAAVETSTETPSESPNPPRRDVLDLVTNAELGYAWLDLSNGRGYDHGGVYGRIGAGAHIPLGTDFFLEAGAGVQFGGAGRNLGQDVQSGFDYQSLFLNGRVGLRLFEDNFRITAGLDVGVAHVGGSGVEFTRNALILPLDNWGVYASGELGVSFFHNVVGVFGRFGGLMGINPHYEFTDQPEGGYPPFGLNISSVALGVSLDLYAAGRELGLWNGLGGNPAPVEAEAEAEAPAEGESESGETAETGEAPEAETEAGVAETETPPPAGVAGAEVVARSVEEVTARSATISAAAVQVRGARSAYRSMRSAARENPELLRGSVETAAAEARRALEAYGQIVDLIAQAQRARLGMTGDESRTAERSIRALQAQQRAAYTLARRSFTDANTMVTEFNRRVEEGVRISTEGLSAPSAPPRVTRRDPTPDREPRETEAPHPPLPAGGGDDEGSDDLLDALGGDDED